MTVFIPTLKFYDHSKNVKWKVYNLPFSDEQLKKLEISAELLESIWKSFGDTSKRLHAGGVSYQMFLEAICTQFAFRGKKLEYLQKYGVKVHYGWVLPISKATEFMDLCGIEY